MQSVQRPLLLKVLQDLGPCMKTDLYAEVPAHPRRIDTLLRQLRDLKQAHICRWESSEPGQRRYPRPVWKAGRGKDAPKPAPMTGAERVRASRERRKNALRSA